MSNANIQRIEEFTRPAFSALAFKFDCENEYMNGFIRGNQAWDRTYGSTYVFLNETADVLIGFFNKRNKEPGNWLFFTLIFPHFNKA